MKSIVLATLAAVAAFAGPAIAAQKCDVPTAQWQPREALEAKLKADGWDVRSIKSEDGCYEAYAIDKDGNKVEAYFNPKTFDRVGAGSSDEDSEG